MDGGGNKEDPLDGVGREGVRGWRAGGHRADWRAVRSYGIRQESIGG